MPASPAIFEPFLCPSGSPPDQVKALSAKCPGVVAVLGSECLRLLCEAMVVRSSVTSSTSWRKNLAAEGLRPTVHVKNLLDSNPSSAAELPRLDRSKPTLLPNVKLLDPRPPKPPDGMPVMLRVRPKPPKVPPESINWFNFFGELRLLDTVLVSRSCSCPSE
mmetsp:Transcript_61829/g.116928  ORF Transcript_61829/g.116928 Transcript_61829/m.116928 type:complete len:162 (+) Transcript_61829:170-655(+)